MSETTASGRSTELPDTLRPATSCTRCQPLPAEDGWDPAEPKRVLDAHLDQLDRLVAAGDGLTTTAVVGDHLVTVVMDGTRMVRELRIDEEFHLTYDTESVTTYLLVGLQQAHEQMDALLARHFAGSGPGD
ncbi:MAG: YbaB/EbfC family nucleoid-associated protein [Dermatophilaceae bacterium]